MRIGLTGRFMVLWAVMALPSVAAQTSTESSYSPPAFYAISDGQTGPVQALFTTPVGASMPYAQQSPFIDAHGDPAILPASYALGCGAACAADPAGECYGGCPDGCPCPYSGVEQVPPNYFGADQCGPHYFDVRAEAVYMKRDKTFGREVVFSRLKETEPESLSSQELDYDYQPGFRLIGRYDLGPLSLVEFGYTGIFDWGAEASLVDTVADFNDIFSLFSRPDGFPASPNEPGFNPDAYGTAPGDVPLVGGSMPQTERSYRHTIKLESDLQTAEMSYRRYWVGYSPRISGTLLAGFRFTQMAEEFHFQTLGNEGSADYGVRARNSLSGFQTGGDVWLCLTQGLRVGGELKAGIYNNRLRLRTDFDPTPDTTAQPNSIPLFTTEEFGENQVAFLSEASIDVVADILPSWSARAGADVLFLNSLALAGENFNTVSPLVTPGAPAPLPATRVPFLNDQGNALYFGFHAGVEYVW
jgi:hypothetical protein